MQVENITTEFVLDDAPDRGRNTILRVTWRPRDPFAVVIELVSRPEHPALPCGVWVATREALRAGLDAPVGEGDVRVTPSVGRGMVCLHLSDRRHQSVAVVGAADLRAFLDRTEQVVPPGEEHPECELDAVLSELLRT